MVQNASPDIALLLFGLFRVVLWALVGLEAWRLRRVLPMASRLSIAGAALLTMNSVIFSFYNAHYAIPSWLVDVAVLASTPGVAATTMGLVLVFRFIIGLRRRLEAGLPEFAFPEEDH